MGQCLSGERVTKDFGFVLRLDALANPVEKLLLMDLIACVCHLRMLSENEDIAIRIAGGVVA